MAVYAYIAAAVDASVARGTVVADTPRQARDQLRQRGLAVHELREHGGVPTGGGALAGLLRGAWFRRGAQAKVTEFVRELSTLLGVGMPLLEAIDTIAKQQTGWFRPVLLALRDRVAAGASLGEAMREQSASGEETGRFLGAGSRRVFDPITISMTEVGEQSGALDQVLGELADFQERAGQWKGRIGAALLYPAIVLAVGVGVSIFLMTYVVPNLLESLLEAGRDLPWITLAVKGVSDLLLHYWWALLLGAVAAAAVAVAAAGSRRGRLVVHRWLLAVPILGDLIRKQAVVRISFVIARLMRSGISFEQAVATAQRSTRNLVLRGALERCESAVRAGRDIGVALEQTAAFPPTVVQVFALGQQSGRLEEMLERLAVDYDRQVAAAASRLGSVLEPVLILVLAAVVGAIAFAVILPILEIGNVL